MNKRNTLRRMLALLCCMAMLLPCVPAAVAAEDPTLLFDDFESYADDAALTAIWKKGGTSTTDAVQLGTEKVFSGKQSIMIEDTDKDNSRQAARAVKTSVPAGTEIIVTGQYYVESSTGGDVAKLNVYANGNNYFPTYSVGKWDSLSGIITTPNDNQLVSVVLVNNKAAVAKIYWDDVKLSVLTADLAVEYVNEKIMVPDGSRGAELMVGLTSKALGLKGVDSDSATIYLKALQAVREEKGAPLTKEDIRTCIANISMDALAEDIEGGIVSVGTTGLLPADVVDMPDGVSAKWASVSPADKAITLSDGKATVNALPTGADDIYKAVLRLATANKSVDINYTIRLVNEAGFNVEIVNDAKDELIPNTVIGATKTGAVATPKISVKDVSVQWDRVESDPNSCVSVSDGQLTVKSIPDGVEYYEAVAVLKLTKGEAVAELEYNIIVYNDKYRVLLPMVNPGFEEVDLGGNPTGWTLLTTAMGSYGEASTQEARTGERSMHMVDTATNERFGYKSVKDASPAKAGYEYILSYWAKGTVSSDEVGRDGIADYLEYNKASGAKITQTVGTAIPVSPTEWTLVSQAGVAPAGTLFIDHMPYSFVTTLCDVYMDDFLTWEITAEGSALLTDELLTGKGDAEALYTRLGIASMGAPALNANYKADYFKTLTAKRAAKGSPLTAAELAAGVKEVNTKVTAETKAVLEKLAAQVVTQQTITKTGVIALPQVDDSTITVKYTAVSGTGKSRIRLTGLGARVDSLPAYGSKDQTAKLTLTLSKGDAKVDVTIALTLKAFTKNMNDMFYAAQTLKLSEYLNGQDATCVTSDLKALPVSLPGSIAIKWQALDSATLEASDFVTAKGKVTRPAYGEPDASVLLRATLSKGGEKYEHELRIIVAAEGTEEARTVVTRNVGFEDDTPKDEFTAPDGWLKGIKWKHGDNFLLTDYANVVEKAYTGKQALRLTGGQTNTTRKGTNIIRTASIMNSAVTTAREGYTYSLDVMAYTDSDTAAPAIILKFWDNFGMLLSSVKTTYASVPGGIGVWKNLNATGVAPAATIMITAELEGGIPAGESYFDDVRLREWAPVANGDFDLGTTGWTTSGKVTDGKLTLTAGQTAVSLVRGANRGVAYYLSMEADGGKAALRFVDKDGKTLAEYANDATKAFFAYAPAGTAGVQVVLTGAMTADNVKITRSSNGTNIIDGDFEISANAGIGTPWELTDATIAANTGKTGAGVTVNADGKVLSNFFPVERGKTYEISADVKGKGAAMTINMYNFVGKLLTQRTVTADGDGWTTLDLSYDQLPEGIDGTNPEHHYAQLVFSGEAVVDNVRVYSVTKNVSNYSVEDIKILPYGTFPFHWSSYGTAATYVANQPGQYSHGVKSLAVEMYGIGEGGVRSSYLQDIKGGKAYEAVVMAKGSGAKLMVEFWDQNFNKLGSEFVTIDSADFKEYSVKGTAPNGAIYASLSVGGDGTGLVYVDEASLNPVVRTIGNNVQTFIDDWFVADSSNVKRTLYEGEKGPEIVTPGGYANTHWDEKDQLWKQWFRSGEALKYRTSKDLLTWSTNYPCFDKATGAEMKVGGYVTIDDNETDPNKRYKANLYVGDDSRNNSVYAYFSSADGVYWTQELDENGKAYGMIGADVHTLIYDPINDEYIMTHKNHTAAGLDGSGVKRDQRISLSKDLMNWTVGSRQYTVGTPMDTVEMDMIRTDGYGNGMYPMGDSYVSLNWRTLLDQEESFGGQLDINMLFSRDLTEDWQRLEGEDGKAHMAIPDRPEDLRDDGQIYTDAGAIRVGDELWWYYNAESGPHGYDTNKNPTGAYAGYAVWRWNGFASMDFSQNGTLTTEQFTLMGSEVHVNAAGTLAVEMLDASGNVVATGKFAGDSVDGVVTWDKSIAGQAGQVVSLRFTSSEAKLYTVQVCGTVFKDVAEDAWYYRAAHYVADNGIMAGVGNGKFAPNDKLTRAMVVQMLYNKVGKPEVDGKHGFSDVPANQWFNNAVAWGTKNDVVSGYGDGKFGPNDNVTIEHIAAILHNYSGKPGFDAQLGNIGKYSSWAKDALTWATDNGILHGVNFTNAKDTATRAQAAQMLTNYLRW